ncbi:MAG: hypothetical protein JW902_06175 [Syntrophaceae bacterium]|nr:hypothetical protein [Syntrophaceae bacterium]
MEAHYLKSSFREKLIEHLFIGELLKTSWSHADYSLEVSKPEVDASGYDIIAESNGFIRHIQLKGSYTGASTITQKVHSALCKKPSGCVIWIHFDPSTLKLGPFYWFGNRPGEPLPNLNPFRVAKHTRADSKGVKKERPLFRVIPKGSFTKLNSVTELMLALFGEVKLL